MALQENHNPRIDIESDTKKLVYQDIYNNHIWTIDQTTRAYRLEYSNRREIQSLHHAVHVTQMTSREILKRTLKQNDFLQIIENQSGIIEFIFNEHEKGYAHPINLIPVNLELHKFFHKNPHCRDRIMALENCNPLLFSVHLALFASYPDTTIEISSRITSCFSNYSFMKNLLRKNSRALTFEIKNRIARIMPDIFEV